MKKKTTHSSNEFCFETLMFLNKYPTVVFIGAKNTVALLSGVKKFLE
jgi:hypothetical protein